MSSDVLELFPPSADGRKRSLAGLYLEHANHRRGSPERPFIYANFVSSLDGRIALDDGDGRGTDRIAAAPAGEGSTVPASLTTAADWMLFQELQAQADCFVTHGGYLRALAAGRLDDILQIGTTPDSEHLLAWRQDNDLPRQPAVVVISASLSFPIPPSLRRHGQKFYIVTTASADRTKVKLWRSKGFEITFAGVGALVEGEPLVEVLSNLGLRSVYLQAGPHIANSLLRCGRLSRYYLTLSQQLLGGDPRHTLSGSGPVLGEAGRLKLLSLLFDPCSERNTAQFFACYEPQASA